MGMISEGHYFVKTGDGWQYVKVGFDWALGELAVYGPNEPQHGTLLSEWRDTEWERAPTPRDMRDRLKIRRSLANAAVEMDNIAYSEGLGPAASLAWDKFIRKCLDVTTIELLREMK